MKTTTLLTITAAMILGLNGCTDAEIAEINQGITDGMVESNNNHNGNSNMQQMQRDCKNYLAEKFISLPMAAFSVRPGYGSNGRYTIPVSINWDEPRVEETGNCIVDNGIVRNYKPNY
jgi:hypothetical protein